jgi:thymidylate kinase
VRRLIIEGVDGVGKSSVAATLAANDFELRHFPYDCSSEDLAKIYRERIECGLRAEIWDRSFISEYVYGKALRGASRLSLDAVMELAGLFVANGGAIAILTADADKIAERMQNGGRAKEFDSARHAAVAEQYGVVAAELAGAGLASPFDTNGYSAAEVCTRLRRELSLWRNSL